MTKKIFCVMNHPGQGELLKDKDDRDHIDDVADFRSISSEKRKWQLEKTGWVRTHGITRWVVEAVPQAGETVQGPWETKMLKIKLKSLLSISLEI